MQIPVVAIAVTLFFSGVGVLADYFLKLASSLPRPFGTWQFAIGLVLYASTAFGWIYVMQRLKLATLGSFYTVAMMLMLAAVGYFQFDEKLTPREWLGFCLAITSVFLMLRDH